MRNIVRNARRRRGAWRLVVCAGCLLLAACGSRSKLPDVSQEAIKAEALRQVAFSFENYIAHTKRLQTVGFRVLTANAEYCANAAPLFGLSALSLENLSPELQPIASQRLGLDASVRVVDAVPNSPARRAGLAAGDRIVAVGKRSIGTGAGGSRELADRLHATRAVRTVPITVMRGARKLTFPLRPVPGCPYPIVLSGQQHDEEVARSGGILIPRSLLERAASDNELAIAIGHELAHRVAGHMKERTSARDVFLGGFPVTVPITAGGRSEDDRKSFSPGHEKVADYLGAYFAARAGFDVTGVDTFWRRLADADATDGFVRVHPVSPERLVLIGKTRDEIALKRSAQAPLAPNWRPRN